MVRRLKRLGFDVRTEVEIGDGRTRGWIDVLAYRAADRVLLCIEVKTQVDDAGRVLRSLGWNVRSCRESAAKLGWNARAIVPMLLVLFSNDCDERLARSADLFRNHLPGSANRMMEFLEDATKSPPEPTLAFLDPRRRGHRWLIRPRIDGGRSRAPYENYADAATRMFERRRLRR